MAILRLVEVGQCWAGMDSKAEQETLLQGTSNLAGHWETRRSQRVQVASIQPGEHDSALARERRRVLILEAEARLELPFQESGFLAYL